jgi:sulfate/thiosulfate transport system substrate-binding protein
MKISLKRGLTLTVVMMLVFLLAACGGSAGATTGGGDSAAPTTATDGGTTAQPGEVTLTLGAYTTPREAYGEIIPLFQAQWKEQTGQTVNFEESYLGSGAQSRAVVEGFEADIVALSLEADINRIADAGLITHDWKANPYNGMVSDSIVVIAVREGNPEGITDWADLAEPGLEVLTPDPASSGGAQWNVMAAYGAATRGQIEGFDASAEGGEAFLKALFTNVTVLDKSARDSIVNYEKGVGDVAITYENEVLVGQQAGQTYEYVIPTSTILIENPAALVDTYVDKHGTREVAEAFLEFLITPEVQRIFAKYGLRPVDPTIAEEVAEQYPPVTDLFTIEEFGGWSNVTEPFFGPDGTYTRIITEVQSGQ